MKVGDKVYLKAVGNNARHHKELYISEDEITKVGRKYFEVGSGRTPLKFSIEDLNEKTSNDTIADWELYFSKQDILDEKEFEKISWDIKMKFNSYSKVNLTLDQLRRINEIIKEGIK